MHNTVTVNGVRLVYDDIGPGDAPGILLVHGYPLSRAMWRAQHDALVDLGWRGILPDLRGYGESQATPPPYSMDLFADDLAALLDHLGLERVVLGGLSMGGYIAFAFWRRHAARVRALVLADTQAAPDTAEARAGRLKALAETQAGRFEAVADGLLPRVLGRSTQANNPALVAEVRRMMLATPTDGVLGSLVALANRPDSTPTLAAIHAPTLLVCGAEDVITPPTAHEAMCDDITGSRLVVIPGAGHMSPLEAPDAFNAALREFLRHEA